MTTVYARRTPIAWCSARARASSAAMRRYKKGTLKSGRLGSEGHESQAGHCLGLSEAREKGAKVPSVPKK